MNETNWKSQIEDFCRNCGSYLKDFLKDLAGTLVSWLWSVMLAFCLASTIVTACESQNAGLLCGLWLLAWIILRVIRYLTVRNMELFAGVINPTSFQSAFTFITDGIISCFTLGKRLSEGGDIFSLIILIVLSVLWLVLFLTWVFVAIVRNHEDAMTAIATLERISMALTDEDTKSFSVAAQCNDGPQKILHWVQAEDEPADEEEDS